MRNNIAGTQIPVHMTIWAMGHSSISSSSRQQSQDNSRQKPHTSPESGTPFIWDVASRLVGSVWKNAASRLRSFLSREDGVDVQVGDKVRILGLVNQLHLNGREGVLEVLKDSSKCQVYIRDLDKTVVVSRRNVEKVLVKQDVGAERWTQTEVSEWLRCTYMHACMRIYIHTYMHAYKRKHAYKTLPTYIHTYWCITVCIYCLQKCRCTCFWAFRGKYMCPHFDPHTPENTVCKDVCNHTCMNSR
jgi:hypothetical protein